MTDFVLLAYDPSLSISKAILAFGSTGLVMIILCVSISWIVKWDKVASIAILLIVTHVLLFFPMWFAPFFPFEPEIVEDPTEVAIYWGNLFFALACIVVLPSSLFGAIARLKYKDCLK